MALSGEDRREHTREDAGCEEVTDLQATSGHLARVGIAELICKTVALWFFAIAVGNLSYMLLMLFTMLFDRTAGAGIAGVAFLGFMPLGHVFVAFLLWTMSGRIGRRMAGNAATPALNMGLSTRALMEIAFATTGLCLLLINVKELLRIAAGVFFLCREHGLDYSAFLNDITWQANFWATVLSCIIAGWLLLGSHRVVEFVLRLRRPQENGGDRGGTDSTLMG